MSDVPNFRVTRACLFLTVNLVLSLFLADPVLADKAPAPLFSTTPASQCGIAMSCPPPILANAGTGPGVLTTPVRPPSATGSDASLIGPSSCGPAAGGSPCPGTGVASTPATGNVNVGAGNPINLINGNKYQREDDMPALPGVLGLEIVRHYNSAYSNPGNTTGILGRGWKLSYETDLHVIGNTIQIIQADGSRVMFSRNFQDPSLCVSADPATGRLRVVATAKGNDYVWTWINGRTLRFDPAGKLVQIVAPTGEFVSLLRDARGLLVQVTDPQGRQLQLTYPKQETPVRPERFGGVSAIASPIGIFHYRYGSVAPKEVTVKPAALLANLVGVSYPAGSGARIYHYENALHPTYLTGISVEQEGSTIASRIATYLYDRNGRAVLSVTGTPARLQTDAQGKALQPARLVEGTGIGQVFLDYSHPGKTILHNSLGQETVYLHAILAGQYRLLETRGAGCARCGEVNVRYRYDATGRLTGITRLDRDGQPIDTMHTDFDQQGRVLALDTTTYQNGRIVLSKAGQRYRYEGKPSDSPSNFSDRPASNNRTVAGAVETPVLPNPANPIEISRTSVVPGRQASTQLRYNAYGQVLVVTESGWAPSVVAAGEPQKIARTTTYRYIERNGRSLLNDIDGPLPNGPGNSAADSDITQVIWDKSGNTVIGLITPGKRSTILAYDNAGHVAAITDANGQKTMFGYDARGRQNMSSTGDQVQYTRYDALDNPIETGRADAGAIASTRENSADQTKTSATKNSPAASPYAGIPNARLGFDMAGRNTWAVNIMGVLVLNEYDTEGKILQSSTHAAELHQIQRYIYDPVGRLSARIDEHGALHQIGWNARDLPVVTRNPRGIENQLTYDASGALSSILQSSNTLESKIQNTRLQFGHDPLGNNDLVTAPNGSTTSTLRDDFGRVVVIDSADSGRATRRHDEAGRLIGSTDALGNTAAYEYDLQGHMVRQTVTPASSSASRQPMVTTWQYDADKLIAVTYPGQSEHYGYQNQRMVKKTVSLTLNNGATSTIMIAYGHDKTSQLQILGLADGSTLGYRRDARQQVTGITRSRIRTSWLEWLLPSQTIVDRLESDIVGLKRVGYGNGIVGKYQRSQEGTLARIVYLKPSQADIKTAQASLVEQMLGIHSAYAAQLDTDATVTAQLQAKIAPKSVLPGALGLPADSNALLDHRYLWDEQGNLLFTQNKQRRNHFAYDASDQLIVASETNPASQTRYDRFFYDGTGNRLLSQQGLADQSDVATGTTKTSYVEGTSRRAKTGASAVDRYDANGQPIDNGLQKYEWDATGRLLNVSREGHLVANYRYNHKGERIAKRIVAPAAKSTHYLYEDRKLVAELNEAGHIVRQYIYLADQPVAMIDTPMGVAPLQSQNSYLQQVANDLRTIFRSWRGDRETISFLHTNHLGAVELVTDATGQPVWQAEYGVYGKMTRIALNESKTNMPDLMLSLRLPGQYADEETGLYYNDHRYYDPQTGRYLSPDPLGLRGGINSYAYVANNPLKYVDPSGLVLFAFDGTGNSATPPSSDSITNVRKFYDAYIGVPKVDKFYITGIGTTDQDMRYAGNIASGDGFEQRLQLAADFLEAYVSNSGSNNTIDIDVIGFSRGAAEARAWVSRLNQALINGSYRSRTGKVRCTNLRFEGVWDTVPHLGFLNGDERRYNFSIPQNVRYAVQAVALNEYRGNAQNFNFISMNSSSQPYIANRIERGFIGSHADIGGGYGTGDISDVSLLWMVNQATKAGVGPSIDLTYLQTHGWSSVSSPIVHDKSGNKLFPNSPPNAEDRKVKFLDGVVTNQQTAIFSGLTTALTSPFIDYLATYCDLGFGGRAGENPEVGNIKMDRYSAWLRQNYDLSIPFNSSGREACAPL